MTVKKVRLDVLMVERELIETREKAKRAIMAGMVFSNTERLDKPGMKVSEDIDLSIKGRMMPYVGRGGYKLEKAIDVFDIAMEGQTLLDIGSSTGGFTDCALQNGAKLSYALDVGYNQLAWKLRNDPRVKVMERTNFRHATPELFDRGQPSIASIDVSFISLKLILPVLSTILEPKGDVIALIKPQFEAGRDQVGKKGIVRDSAIHIDVIERIVDFAQREHFHIKGLTHSPITGGDGNIEFLAHFIYDENKRSTVDHKEIENVVRLAHKELNAST
ncbi:23S rRNA (cytidine1920-2'-O)/16S rRNA (cytidine1409-2'-O)-methyltransferase [Pelagirhabdus alkalitolerans]|uniref:23S rRNA (Cytidine1920-2'-O)/16S rRNA (Cytidine1409-2'-O)-methyltransferase n=1 Tax=Pelagirhabdus alkalitolerans TaxID=1612202 RepID=A0A1G6I2H9_9BACI|nr:23S rRNA (cytidine1920-2'-O)/16S rRNA (cytidine1409-2'-O)-methyltransferase [Pelagirhabdus alkalitolerans]